MTDSTFTPSSVAIFNAPQESKFTPFSVANTSLVKDEDKLKGFKAFGTYVKKNVSDYLNKVSSEEGLKEELLGGAGAGLGTMIGKAAKTFNTADALRAEELAANGVNAREIWEKTQNRIWSTGIRQEIDDSVMTMKNPFTPDNLNKEFMVDSDGISLTHLNKVINHPELFKAYPSLKKTTVRVDPSLSAGEASYTAVDDVITVAPGAQPTDYLHEIQHAIQAREGWQGGGSPKQFKGRTIVLPNGELKTVNSFTEYKTLAGEWEARQTELRAKLSAEDRAKIFPDDTSAKFDLPSRALRVHDPSIRK
jgi:hypothetical protein